MRKLLSRGAWVAVVLALAATTLLAGDRGVPDVAVSTTADLSQFNPGNIVSDGVFFNAGAMSAGDVDSFIQAKGLGCRTGDDGTPCLKDFTQDTSARAGDSYCAGYSPGARESAGVIIAKVATSCGINPAVLLVILQKEQGLVLGSGSSLLNWRYRTAMGFGCPDTAACDSTYYGFQNQMYSAARQFRIYAANPDYFGYRAGRTSDILYNPDSACGSSPVYVQNQATAGLYIYTPYQPNASSLAAGYGQGDSCGAYGNRNFWLYFTDWFGSTQTSGNSAWDPIGALDQPTVQGRVATVSGWAADPDSIGGVTTVHVYVDGQGVAILQADQEAAGITGYHGYAAQVPLTPGSHRLCTYGINSGRGDHNTLLGCQTTDIATAPGDLPFGVQNVGASGRNVVVSGWGLDPNSPTGAMAVHVYSDGAGVAILQADQAGSPANTYLSGAGDRHGYAATLMVGAGRHNVCAYGINTGAGSSNTLLGCHSVVVEKSAFNPVGAWESMKQTGAKISISGWAQDLDAAGANSVHVYVGSAGVAVLTANGPHATADGHGFQASITLDPGTQNVCLYDINVGEGTGNILLGCRQVTVTPADFNPVGSLASVSATGGTVSISGQASDPDTTAPIPVHVYVDGQGAAVLSADRPDATVDGHGYAASLVLSDGRHNVCAYGINQGRGTGSVELGCQTVAVSGLPVGALTSVTAVGSKISVVGHATDPDTSAPIPVHVYVDGQGAAVLSADQADATADGHGYRTNLTVAAQGQHTVCAYGINRGPGAGNALLGCASVTVSSAPAGALESVNGYGTQVSVSGYAADPDTTGPIPVHVYVDGQGAAVLSADQPNPTVDGHGYATTLALALGEHTVCTYGINQGPGPGNSLLGCKQVTVSMNPAGILDPVTATGDQVSVSGYARDPDTTGPIPVHVYVDGQGAAVLSADQPNATANGHGYAVTLTQAPGRHTVCTYGINQGTGTGNVLLGCKQVAVG